MRSWDQGKNAPKVYWRSAIREEARSTMATADQFKALVQSHAEGDDSHFYSVAMQVAARTAKQGHSRFAQDLREMVDAAKADSGRAGKRLDQSPSLNLVVTLRVCLRFHIQIRGSPTLLLNPTSTFHWSAFIEQRQQDRLMERGLEPVRSLALRGSPWDGKTLSRERACRSVASPFVLDPT